MSIHLVLLNWNLHQKDHLHLTKSSYEKLSLLFARQLNSVLGKTHETPQEPQLAYSYKLAISFTLNKEEFPPLLSVYSQLRSFNYSNESSVQIQKTSEKNDFPVSQPNICNSVTS